MVLTNSAFAADLTTVREGLQGYEWQANNREAYQQPGVPEALQQISLDKSELPFVRRRAVAALSLLEGSKAEPLLLDLMEQDVGAGVQKRAISGFCQRLADFTKVGQNRAQAGIRPLLASADAHLRVQVANCLHQLQAHQPDDETTRALAEYETGDRSGWERNQLRRIE